MLPFSPLQLFLIWVSDISQKLSRYCVQVSCPSLFKQSFQWWAFILCCYSITKWIWLLNAPILSWHHTGPSWHWRTRLTFVSSSSTKLVSDRASLTCQKVLSHLQFAVNITRNNRDILVTSGVFCSINLDGVPWLPEIHRSHLFNDFVLYVMRLVCSISRDGTVILRILFILSQI